jgi:hypothetical protein
VKTREIFSSPCFFIRVVVFHTLPHHHYSPRCHHTANYKNITFLTSLTTAYKPTIIMMETAAAPMMEHDFAQQEGMEEEVGVSTSTNDINMCRWYRAAIVSLRFMRGKRSDMELCPCSE